ncbi:MAG: glycosyltransferase, partial [Candidatus Limnocylindrales bacterium]
MSPPRLTLAFLGDPDSVHTRRWLGFFAERGHAVHLFVSAGEPRTPGLPEAIQLEAYPGYGRHLRPRGGLAATRSLRRRLRDLRPDVLHAHYVTRYGWLGRLSGYHPFVVTAWGSDVFRIGSASPVARWLTRHALTSADLVTVVSDELGRAAVATGARPAVVRRVQFGVDGSRFLPGPAPAALRDRLGLEGCRVVFAPRAIRPVYRQATVVEALPTLPPDVVVVMSALRSDPATLDDLLRLAEHLGVADRLRLVEAMPHPEMADYYRLAD